MASNRPRVAYKWRILCHERDRGRPWSAGNHETETREHDGVDPKRTEFDELVVGHWLHIEEMDTRTWWMNIGGVTVWINVGKDGKPENVTVFEPGGYDSPWPGVTYDGAVAP